MKRRRRFKKQKSRKKLAYGLVASILALFFLFYSFQNPSSDNLSQTFQFKAGIVDHLSLSQPNQTFIQTATDILETAGFTVDYHPSKDVTVEFYRNLPTHDYGLIVLRVHSAFEPKYGSLDLFTSEPYSTTKYVYEQLTEQIGQAAFIPYSEGDPTYFAITPKFVRESMKGRFDNTIIIMMGCSGLENNKMAEAFIDKGAKVYISWDKLVTSSHTDHATTILLQHLTIDKQTINQAVVNTMEEAGPDPSYNSVLLYYPLEAGEYTIQNIIGTKTANTSEITISQGFLKKRKRYEIH